MNREDRTTARTIRLPETFRYVEIGPRFAGGNPAGMRSMRTAGFQLEANPLTSQRSAAYRRGG
jgi:hypothetical protein